MNYPRAILAGIETHLSRGKSILLLGARQTGKTTLLSTIKVDLTLNLMDTSIRRRYESRPEIFSQELRAAYTKKNSGTPLKVFIDEIQKVPELLNDIQVLIDEKIGQFILTGSSARKLRQPAINWLPGRIVKFQLDPLLFSELPLEKQNLEQLLLYGALPGIVSEENDSYKNTDLKTYVDTYLEEEIRAESLVRKIGEFSRFLELAASESGYLINMSKLSSDVGVAQPTVENFFQILEDCLIVERVQPITQTKTRRRLLRANKFLFFDLGVRRLAAREGVMLPAKMMGHLFEQFVGLQLIDMLRQECPEAKVTFWRDSNGIEVDWVIEYRQHYLPIEVKWSDKPDKNLCKPCEIFMAEYNCPLGGILVCRTPTEMQLTDTITAIPWQNLGDICEKIKRI